jgi:diguanylate cyclase (GGDEF)-like protein
MPKGGPRQGRQSKARPTAARPRRSGERRAPTPPDAQPTDAALRPSRSTAMRLAAEVERLERELQAARSRMATLEARADVDPLTDLPNRRGFERELKRSLAFVKRYGASAALLYLDLDGFKSVNDRHGHAAGDAVLKAVAMVLNRHVRASDVVGRLGGDEFAVLLWNIGEADAGKKALAIEAAVGRTTATHAGALLTVGASAGAALLLPLDQPADVLHRADCAMYARKAERNSSRAAG